MKLYPREQYLAKIRKFYHAPDLIKSYHMNVSEVKRLKAA